MVFIDGLTVCLTDRLISWLTDWLTDWVFDWLINWLTVRISKGFLWWVWICECVTHSLSIDRDQLFSSNPNSLHDMKMTKFIVAKGFLSYAFTHVSLWEIDGNEVVMLTLAAKASTRPFLWVVLSHSLLLKAWEFAVFVVHLIIIVTHAVCTWRCWSLPLSQFEQKNATCLQVHFDQQDFNKSPLFRTYVMKLCIMQC